MKAVIFKIALLFAMLSFPFMGIFSNDTLSTFLISEGDRSLALEKLLQFKCTDIWTPLLKEYTYDKEGNLYVSVSFGQRLELPSGEVKTNPNIYVEAIIKFSPEYEMLWYKEVNGNSKTKQNNVILINCDEIFYDDTKNELYLYVSVNKHDTINIDTCYYDDQIIAIFISNNLISKPLCQ